MGALVLVIHPLVFCDFSFATRAGDASAVSGFLGVEGEVVFLEDLENFFLDVSVARADVVTGDVGAVASVEHEVSTILEALGATFAGTSDAFRRVQTFREPFDLTKAAERHLETPGLFCHGNGGVAEEERRAFLGVVFEVSSILVTLLLDEVDVFVVDVLSTSALTLSSVTFVTDGARGGAVNAGGVGGVGDLGEASVATATHGGREVSVGTDDLEGALFGVFLNVETHPGEPDGFDVVVEVLSEFLSDGGGMGSQEVVHFRNATRSKQTGSEGTRAHGEAAEEGFVGG